MSKLLLGCRGQIWEAVIYNLPWDVEWWYAMSKLPHPDNNGMSLSNRNVLMLAASDRWV